MFSAVDGALLYRKDLTAADSYCVWADPITFMPDDGPQGTATTPHPTGTPSGHVSTGASADGHAEQRRSLHE